MKFPWGRVKYEQLRNEVVLAGYVIERVTVPVPGGVQPYGKLRWRAFSPNGLRLSFWSNAYLDSEREIYAACARHLHGTGNTSAPIEECYVLPVHPRHYDELEGA